MLFRSQLQDDKGFGVTKPSVETTDVPAELILKLLGQENKTIGEKIEPRSVER